MNDLYQPTRDFEQKVAEFCGFKYGVAVESCSAAIFLSCVYKKVSKMKPLKIPAKTYPSTPAGVIHAGGKVFFENFEWQDSGMYELGDSGIYDSALYIGKNLKEKHKIKEDGLVCLSFHHKKMLPIGRGGMILTDSIVASTWLKMARHDGRHDKTELCNDTIYILGWNMALTPEQASRGIALLGNLLEDNKCSYQKYPFLPDMPVWKIEY